MTGDFALRVFEEKMGELLTAVRSWTPKHEMSSFLEKVKPAMDVFRSEVITAVEMNAALKT
jgi:hypothetical protein